MSSIDLLEVNKPVANLILVTDNSGSGGGSVKHGKEPLSFHSIGGANHSSKGDEWREHDSPVVRDVDVSSLILLLSPVDLEWINDWLFH